MAPFYCVSMHFVVHIITKSICIIFRNPFVKCFSTRIVHIGKHKNHHDTKVRASRSKDRLVRFLYVFVPKKPSKIAQQTSSNNQVLPLWKTVANSRRVLSKALS